MRRIVVLLLAIGLGLGATGSVSAEGRCPPGQYPVGGQGVGGCAPIPGGGAGSDGSARPTGKWIKTWGAISMSSATGDIGTSVGKTSKAEAMREAKSQCATYGAQDCRETYTYKNQCVAAANPEKGRKIGVSFSSGASKESASEDVLKYCASQGGGACTIIYTDCTEPLFDRY